MAVNHIPKKRGGIAKVLSIGLDPSDGNTRHHERTVLPDPSRNLHVRDYPKEIRITFDTAEHCDGRTASIRSEWYTAPEDGKGKVIQGERVLKVMYSSPEDILAFVAAYYTILYPAQNGKTRKIDGFNALPVFSAQGAVLSYTEEQMNEEPIFSGPGSYGYVAPPEGQETGPVI